MAVHIFVVNRENFDICIQKSLALFLVSKPILEQKTIPIISPNEQEANTCGQALCLGLWIEKHLKPEEEKLRFSASVRKCLGNQSISVLQSR